MQGKDPVAALQARAFMKPSPSSVYLDHSATTPVWPEVMAAMQPYFGEMYGNPSSLHASGRKAYAGLQDARQRIARRLGASASEIVFTSGGTESDNAALRGIAWARRNDTGARRLVSSPVEHHAVLHTLEDMAESQGFALDLLPVNAAGRVHPPDLESVLDEDVALVSVMSANNEIGTVQPVAALGALCQARGVPFHTDAVQALCKMPMRVDELGVDALSASAHKFHGPKGIGFLYLRTGTPFRPLLLGGGHEGRRRAGTENVPLICGMAAAMDRNLAEAAAEWPRQRALRDRLMAGVLAGVEGAYLTGDPRQRLPHHASFILPGLEAEAFLIALDMAGILASSGSACTSGAQQPSHVLSAVGIAPPDSYGALRFSLGRGTAAADIEYALAQLQRIAAQLRAAGAPRAA